MPTFAAQELGRTHPRTAARSLSLSPSLGRDHAERAVADRLARELRGHRDEGQGQRFLLDLERLELRGRWDSNLKSNCS